MEINEVTKKLLGQKVTYCRTRLMEDGETELHRGNGVIVGIIVGASRRVQIMVKDDEADKNQAWTLDLMCVNPTDEDAARYFEHHKNIKRLVDEHNQAQRQREKDKIKEVDEFNHAMFGQPLEI